MLSDGNINLVMLVNRFLEGCGFESRPKPGFILPLPPSDAARHVGNLPDFSTRTNLFFGHLAFFDKLGKVFFSPTFDPEKKLKQFDHLLQNFERLNI